MESSVHREICGVLTTPRPFFYFPGRYALRLLSYVAGDGCRKAELARGAFARLLDKPIVRSRLALAGDGTIDEEVLTAWPARYQAYHWTFGRWGRFAPWKASYDQTTRPGVNLVMQLNFAAAHERDYRALVQKGDRPHYFNYRLHPVSMTHATLSWARIDLDFGTGEALIEEIQSDWVRIAKRYGESTVRTGVKRYVEHMLWPHRRVWEEATMSAAIELIYRELGIRRIFFHTHEGGARLKELPPAARPPRRIYTKLPRQFCFRIVDEAPRFLRESKDRFVRERVARVDAWQVLDLP